MSVPVGRLAPSPTGLLHLGHARSFLLAWWHVRKRGGRIVMRIEDLDGPRARPEMIDAAVRDLRWLGLDWDGEPLVQSSGTGRILDALHELERRGFTYPCVCSRSDVRSAQSAPQLGDAEPRYPGTCRGRFDSAELAAQRSGRPVGIRFKVEGGITEFYDGIAGVVRCDVARDVGDFLIGKRDGAPAYQLAVVVDDAHHGVTEVVRGDDLLPSTARQLQLQRALDLPHPSWFHLPLVLDETGRRLAKRADDLSLAELAGGGTDPRAVVAWAARSAGMDVAERITAEQAIPAFDFDKLPHTPVRLTQASISELRAARA
jgi:glutamyl-tRNA synthetase